MNDQLPFPGCGDPIPPHPAEYSDELIPHLAAALRGHPRVLDPMAGLGRKLARIAKLAGVEAVGIEIEHDWSRAHPAVRQGDALALPFPEETFDAIVVSPTYGNRMADTYTDGTHRITYTSYLGHAVAAGSSARLQWGPDYRDLHEAAWTEAARVLKPAGRFVVNVKDHIRQGVTADVTAWHTTTIVNLGFTLTADLIVRTPGQRNGTNGHLRIDHEHILILDRQENR